MKGPQRQTPKAATKSPESESPPILPPRPPLQRQGKSSPSGQRPHSMLITSSGSHDALEETPPFPVPTLLRNNQDGLRPPDISNDPFKGSDPFQSTSSSNWENPGTFYDVPPPARPASQQPQPSSSPRSQHKKQHSDPFDLSSLTVLEKASSRQTTSNVSSGAGGIGDISLFPSVDEIEREISLKHTPAHTTDNKVSEEGRDRSLSGLFDDPKYYRTEKLNQVIQSVVDNKKTTSSGATPEEDDPPEYDAPVELLQRYGSRTPDLPTKSNLKSSNLTTADSKPSGPSPTPAPRSNPFTKSHSPMPPLPPRNTPRARSTSPTPPDKSKQHSQAAKKLTLPASEDMKQLLKEQWMFDLVDRGYTMEEIDRALQVASNDLELAEKILLAFASNK